MNAKPYKVLVIGMDGATFDVIHPMVKQGKLPTLSKLMASGVSASLRSTFPPVTAPAWVSFMTGKNPGKHGVFDFCANTTHGYTRPFVSSRDIQAKTLWTLLSEKGRRVGVINVPITYPPEEVNGFIIPGYQRALTHREYTYPAGLFKEIEKMGYLLDYSGDMVPYTDDKTDYIEGWKRVVEARKKTSLRLMQEYEWDFFMTVYKCTDEVQHHFWRYHDNSYPDCPEDQRQRYGTVIEEFYQKVDQAVGEQVALLDKNSIVIIMSDHGAGPLHKHFNLNRWLIQEGHMGLKRMRYLGLARYPYSYLYYKILRRVGINGIDWTVPRHLPRAVRKKIDPRLGLDTSTLIDWKRTKAYMGNMTEQGIYINLKGREPEGIISPGYEYERLREELAEKLLSVKDPETGAKIVERVFKKEELYQGPYADKAADLYFLLKDNWTYILDGTLYRNALVSPANPVSGTHRMEGILIMAGDVFKNGITLKETSIMDIFPTILYAMGIPIPDDLDGSVIAEAFKESHIRDYPAHFEEASGMETKQEPFAYSDKDNDLIRQKLKSLGYM